MSLSLYLGIAVLGGVGAACRVLLDAKLSSGPGAAFPIGTLAVNLLGALLLGLLVGAGLSGDLLLLLSLGLLGSFTTFSTWVLQSYSLAGQGMTRACRPQRPPQPRGWPVRGLVRGCPRRSALRRG